MGTTDNAVADAATRQLQQTSADRTGNRTASGRQSGSASGLSASVGMGAANKPGDVMRVSGALAANGLMDAPQAHADSMLFKGIIGAQERMDSSLKRDGIVNPGGPTEQAFSRLAGQGFVKPAPTPASVTTGSRPATGDKVLNAELRADKKHDAVAAAEARIKANLSDDSRSDYRKAQDRDRLQKARDEAESADALARHEQAERTRRLQEKRAEEMRKAVADARDDAEQRQERAQRGLTILAETAGDVLDSVLGGMTRHSGAGRHPGLSQAKAPGLAPSVDAATAVRPAGDPGSGDDAPVPDDPGQDDPQESEETPEETPDDPGQDDPEDPCARYAQAVDLANQVMELELEKQQVLERLQGMTAVYVGAKLHPDAVVGEFNRALGMSDEEFYRQRKELLEKLKGAQQKLDPVRDDLRDLLHERQDMNAKLAHARGQLARAEAALRRCEG